MNSFVRAAAMGLVALAAIGGTLYLLGRGDGGIGGEPSMAPTPSAVEAPSPTPGISRTIVAMNIEFDRLTLQVPAGRPFTITLRNADVPGIVHDIDIRSIDGTSIAEQEPIDGGTERSYAFGKLARGTYVFLCSVHPIPSMTGTLTVR